MSNTIPIPATAASKEGGIGIGIGIGIGPRLKVEETSEKEEDYGAFIQRFQLLPPTDHSSPSQPLQGLTFAVKDIFDISGYVTGFGNPDWARTHPPPNSTAPAVAAILQAGATCVAKTIMDEMAYSINGENYHYGTPTNPCAPDRVPGGSSSGSAVAVAAGLVDFSLGTDTGGSVRVPAAYCGILGFRPSHGTISAKNVIPMAQSFDTVGWFARDPSTLTLVGRVLLPSPTEATQQPTRIIIPEDCFQVLGSPSDQLSKILTGSLENMYGSNIIKHQNLGDYVYDKVPSARNIITKLPQSQASNIPALAAVSYAMRSVQRIMECLRSLLFLALHLKSTWQLLHWKIFVLEHFVCFPLLDCLGFARSLFLLVCTIIYQFQFLCWQDMEQIIFFSTLLILFVVLSKSKRILYGNWVVNLNCLFLL